MFSNEGNRGKCHFYGTRNMENDIFCFGGTWKPLSFFRAKTLPVYFEQVETASYLIG